MCKKLKQLYEELRQAASKRLFMKQSKIITASNKSVLLENKL